MIVCVVLACIAAFVGIALVGVLLVIGRAEPRRDEQYGLKA